MCRRPLPAPAPIDYAATVQDASCADLHGLQRAYQMTRHSFKADAVKAKQSILAIVAERLGTFDLLELRDASEVLPLQEPVVWTAIGSRLEVLADQVDALRGLQDLACSVQPLRQASTALESTVDRAVTRATQRIVSTSSLHDLWAGVTCFKTLISNPCVDVNILAMTLHDVLQGSLAGNLDTCIAKDFVRLVGSLSSWSILSKSMEAYLAHIFTARLTTFISGANLDDLDWIEDNVSMNLPVSQVWEEASERILLEVARQTERLSRFGAVGSLSRGAGFAERRREVRVQAVVQGMKRIDAGIQEEALADARANWQR